MTRALVLVALLGGVAFADGEKRYDGPLVSFSYPASATVAPGADPRADVAVTVTLPNGITATVLASAKRLPPGMRSVATTAQEWHEARIKNRAAWGMKPHGGPPPEEVGRSDDKRWLRWRDRIGSVLGAQEQTMTCGAVAGHLGCVVVSAPQKERERADAIGWRLAYSLAIKR